MTETPLQHNPHHVLHRIPDFALPHSATRHHKYRIYQTIYQAKSIEFTDHNTLWVKHPACQKAESLIAALFQS